MVVGEMRDKASTTSGGRGPKDWIYPGKPILQDEGL